MLVVHAEDGLDEISVGAPTRVAELQNGRIEVYKLTPEYFGLTREPLSWLAVDSAQASLDMIRGIFFGSRGPARDVVLLNAGAAIYASGLVNNLKAGVERAALAIDSGAAAGKLEELVKFTQRFLNP